MGDEISPRRVPEIEMVLYRVVILFHFLPQYGQIQLGRFCGKVLKFVPGLPG
jgi:hypothetical protein